MRAANLLLVACFLTSPGPLAQGGTTGWHHTQRTAPSSSIINRENAPQASLQAQSSGGVSSSGVFSSQVTLVCVKLAKKEKQNKKGNITDSNLPWS